jgi:hypothetical protein
MEEQNQTNQNHEQEPQVHPKTKKVNKPLFWAGIALMAITAIVLVTVEKDLGLWPMFMGILGIVSIGASRYRPMK